MISTPDGFLVPGHCPSQGSLSPTKLDTMAAGCLGGMVQLVVACPVDMVKIKLQMQRGERGEGGIDDNGR